MQTRTSRVLVPLLVILSIAAILTYQQWPSVLNGRSWQTGQDIILDNVDRPKQISHTFNGQQELSSSRQGLDAILNSTLGFQKVFAINLPSRTDKRDGLLLTSKVTGFDIDFIDGVVPSNISNKSLPHQITGSTPITGGVLGCWRAHMNFMARVVQEDLATALVLEDDVDWDMRLLQQLQDFAKMSNALLSKVDDGQRVRIKFEELSTSISLTSTTASPYGDGWDVLLFGNCGVDIDPTKAHVVHTHDDTVPDLIHIHIYGDPGNLRLNPYPTHARVAGYAVEQTCTYAYAVTQQAARRILFDLGLERLNQPIDMMLRDWCEGKFPEQGPPRRCIGVMPSLFESYRREGPTQGDSDIDGDKDHIGYRAKSGTPNIQRSVRMNLRKLLDGVTELEDQYPSFTFESPIETSKPDQ